MRVFLIKVGCMNYGICASDSVEKVKNYYLNNHCQAFDIVDITDAYEFPVLEIMCSKNIKDLIK
jgi:hypothetical protein